MASVVLLGCSGSVACIKIPNIITEINSLDLQCSLILVPTLSATYFFPKTSNGEIHVASNKPSFRVIYPSDSIRDSTEFEIESIAAVLIAPLAANLMARLTIPFDERTGTASNIEIILDMLTNAGKLAGESNLPFLITPAMNPVMWNSLHTRSAIHRLRIIYGHNFHVLPTALKASMCGEIGYGNMETPENIARYLKEALNRTIEPLPEDLIDVPLPLFPIVDTWHENPDAMHSEGTNLKLEDMTGSAPPYSECLRRVLGTWKPGEPFNILVATEEHDIHCEHSSARSLSKSIKEDLMKTAALSVGKNRYVPIVITEKFVLAKQANSALPLYTHDMPAAFEEQITFTDADEWQMWKKRGDPVLHILLRQWATVFVLVHPSPQIQQKITVGMCDDLMTSVARAWDFRKGFFVVFPETPSATNEHLVFSGTKCVRQKKESAFMTESYCIPASSDV